METLKTKVYETGYAYSRDIAGPGTFEIPVGTLEITLLSNIDGSILPNSKVYLYEQVKGEENPQYRTGGYTDNLGVIRFTPFGLGNGTHSFLVRARSPVNDQWRDSDPLTEIGTFPIQAGNDPLRVSVKDFITKDPASDLKLYALEQIDTETVRWKA